MVMTFNLIYKTIKHPAPALLVISIAGCILMSGCSPLNVAEIPDEYNVAGEVVALMVPDTVQSGQLFTVKISFPNICGGGFSQMFRTDGTNKVTLTPVIHVVTPPTCPATYSVATETTRIQLNTVSSYQVVADGRYGQLEKTVKVVTTLSTQPIYTFRFQFQNLSRMAKPNQTALLSFLDRVPVKTVYITSDSSGVWDTTFVDSVGSFRYSVNEISFKANKGIREDGVFLFE